jgi:hypothetical protein
MKNHFALCRPFPPFAILVAACLACVGAASGQGTPPTSRTQPKKEVSPATEPYVLEIVDGALKPGGPPATLGRIADVLRKLYPDVNIVLAPELGQVQVRDLKLRATELPEALDALRIASGDAFAWQNGILPGLIDPRTGKPMEPAPEPRNSSLYILTRNYPPPAGNPRRMVEVFNLSGYLEQLGKHDEKDVAASLEKIKMIVSDTLNQVMQGNMQAEDQPSFQFHPGANLFIVIGPPQAIEVTSKVVKALPGVGGARDYFMPRPETAPPPAIRPPPAGPQEPRAPRPPAAIAPPAAK